VRHEDIAAVQALIREQERQVQACAAARACPRAHYFRGLAALYEDRAVAATHFQAVLAGEPDGPYGSSSRDWMQLLSDGRNGSDRATDLMHAMERLVREVLEEEAAIRQAADKETQTVQSLRRQLKERENKIDELTRQIDALKRVDQEIKDRIKPSRPVN
jgi:phage shock protein A